MQQKYDLGVHIFTRDLRLEDNTTLIKMLKLAKKVVPIFVFNPEQVTNKNEYKSDNCIQFMCECLEELDTKLKQHESKLFIYYGDLLKIIRSMKKLNNSIDCVGINKDYTPFAVKRENEINHLCDELKIDFICEEDYLLNGCNDIKNGSGNPYVKFTPYLRTAIKQQVSKVQKNNYSNYVSNRTKFMDEYDGYHKLYKQNKNINVHGGRSNAVKILLHIANHKNYNDERDIPSISTTNLSAYIKFNVVSIREVYHTFKTKLPKNNKLVQQLYWRDFYTTIVYHYPNVIGHNMNNHKIKWLFSKTNFDKWKNGLTGFPLVDAGMRQLNETGYMHNRVRMLVGNFLVKILHIDWKHGEKYFAQNLVDYDPSVNNMNWQWVASTGTDSQPYFRYFNPWSQSIKFDNECKYIKKWIPELKDVDADHIHKWNTEWINNKKIKYPKPIVDDIGEQIKITMDLYKK
jgi:deoxyribodipyrimidine photo-lyase